MAENEDEHHCNCLNVKRLDVEEKTNILLSIRLARLHYTHVTEEETFLAHNFSLYESCFILKEQ